VRRVLRAAGKVTARDVTTNLLDLLLLVMPSLRDGLKVVDIEEQVPIATMPADMVDDRTVRRRCGTSQQDPSLAAPGNQLSFNHNGVTAQDRSPEPVPFLGSVP